MRSIITVLPTTLFIIGLFVAAAIFLAPAPAQAAVVDDLLKQVQSMMEQLAKMQVQLLELQKAGGVTSASVASAPTTTTVPTGSVLGAKTFKFTQETIYGATNDDVKRIQELMKLDNNIYPEGITSGFFGPATQRAIRNLQTKFGLDPVGVVGPATTALLERLISQQNSDGTYPADILDPARPTGSVLGATTSSGSQNTLLQQLLEQVAKLQAQQNSGNNTSSSDSSNTNTSNINKITVEMDDGESRIKVFYKNGDIKDFWVTEDEKTKIIKAVAKQINISEQEVERLAGFGKIGNGNQDDVEEIFADVDISGQETSVDVVYDGGDEDSFTVAESDYNKIIKAIADELDMDAEDVKVMIVFDWNIRVKDIDKINVTVSNKEASVRVRLSGGDIRFVLEEDRESKIVKEIARILDIDEADVKDILDIQFND